jgi:hypothetical protein
MTGDELKQLRHDLGEAVGQRLSTADMARICGLAPKNGADTWRKWEEGEGPSGPVAALMSIYAWAARPSTDGDIPKEAMRAEILRRLA